jgi:ATP-binding cassette subfamily B (MDR/TAP) protein 1
VRLAVFSGLAMGGIQFTMFSSYAVAFVYGAWRVSLGLYTGGQVLNVLFAVMMGGFQLGMVGGGAPSAAPQSLQQPGSSAPALAACCAL